jgi:hypothetical protein
VNRTERWNNRNTYNQCASKRVRRRESIEFYSAVWKCAGAGQAANGRSAKIQIEKEMKYAIRNTGAQKVRGSVNRRAELLADRIEEGAAGLAAFAEELSEAE